MNKNARRRQSFEFAFGVILIIVGVAGFGPAGPFPTENVVIGIAIWLTLAIVPTIFGFLLIRKSQSK
jgi:hypothetical protein